MSPVIEIASSSGLRPIALISLHSNSTVSESLFLSVLDFPRSFPYFQK